MEKAHAGTCCKTKREWCSSLLTVDNLKPLWGQLDIRNDIANALPFLIEYASKAKTIVELGCHFGNGSTKAFRIGMANNSIADCEKLMITIDIKPMWKPGAKPTEPWWNMVTGSSIDAQTLEIVKKTLDGRPVDLLFIDTLHTGDQIVKELALYLPLCAYDCMIVFHDTGIRGRKEFPDYVSAIEEYALSHNCDLEHVVTDGYGLSAMRFSKQER